MKKQFCNTQLTSAPVLSVNDKTGHVTLNISDIPKLTEELKRVKDGSILNSSEVKKLQTQLNTEIARSTGEDAKLEGSLDSLKVEVNSHTVRTDNPHSITKAQVGLGNVDNTSDLNKPVSTAVEAKILEISKVSQDSLEGHTTNISNPHKVTKAQVGLGNVDNTSDLEKPVSTATSLEIARQASIAASDLDNHIVETSNPHKVTKAQVGLGNVDNTNDLDKPVSIATKSYIISEVREVENELVLHASDLSNPHKVTKSQIGLNLVDNTSDLDKPVSTATEVRINTVIKRLDADKADSVQHISSTNNPHRVTKAQVGLGNVDNTSDANKPISNATDQKFSVIIQNQEDTKVELYSAVAEKADKQYVDDKLSSLSGGLAGSYLTLALAEADKANIPKNSTINVTNDPDSSKNGQYTWDGIKLTKSAFDPLTEAKEYTNSKVQVVNLEEQVKDCDKSNLVKVLSTSEVFTWKVDEWVKSDLSDYDKSLKTINQQFLRKAVVQNEDYLFALTDKRLQMTDLTIDSSGQFADFAIERMSTRMLGKSGINFQETSEYLFALTDKRLQMTDLTLDSSGQFADFVLERLKTKINKANGFSHVKSNSDYMFALTDKRLQMTDLSIDSSGQFADFVLERLAGRLEGILNIKREEPKEYIFEDTIKPVRPDKNKLALWGSSSLSAMTQYFQPFVIANNIGDFYKGARGGERIQQISARLGSNPALLSFPDGEIPAEGEVKVNVNWSTVRLMLAYEGVVQGVHGTFRVDFDTLQHYFSRSSKGDAVVVDPLEGFPFIPDASSYKDAVCILNLGKNNFSANTDNSAEFVLERTKDVVNFLSPYYKYIIVMGHFMNTGTTETHNKRVLDCNEGLKQTYGDLYYDMQAYISGSQIWEDTGITPTTTDLEQQATGQKPDSLSSDYQHLNGAASRAVVKQVIDKIESLKWY